MKCIYIEYTLVLYIDRNLRIKTSRLIVMHAPLLQFLIIALTFASYSIEVNSGDRLAVNITLFLTAVAFKLVVKQSLPTISYLTYLVSVL